MFSRSPHPPVLPVRPTLTLWLSLWVTSWHNAPLTHPTPLSVLFTLICHWLSSLSHTHTHTHSHLPSGKYLTDEMKWKQRHNWPKDNDQLSIFHIAFIKISSTPCPCATEYDTTCFYTCECVCVIIYWSIHLLTPTENVPDCETFPHQLIFFSLVTLHTHKHTTSNTAVVMYTHTNNVCVYMVSMHWSKSIFVCRLAKPCSHFYLWDIMNVKLMSLLCWWRSCDGIES